MADSGHHEGRGPRKTVWILNHYATPPGSGSGTRHYDLGQELARRGWRVVIFAAGFNHFTGREEQLAGAQAFRSELLGQVRFIWLRTTHYRGNGILRILNMLSYFIAVLLVGQRAKPRPEVIIGSTVHPLAALAAWLLSGEFGARFYFEIRDLWPQTLIDIGAMRPSGPSAKLLRGMESFLVARATAVISLLPGVQRYLDENGLKPKALVHLPNGVRLSAGGIPAELPAQARDLLAQWSGRFIVAYTGAHGTHNNLDVALRAAAILEHRPEPIGLVLVGDGPSKMQLRKDAASLELRHVAFLDPIAKDALPTFLAAVDVGLVNVAATDVHRYGISFNKVFDYMASALPIVFACDTPFDPIAASGAGVTVPPNDPEKLADAISSLARMTSAERERIGRLGRTYVEGQHDIEKLGGQLDALLREDPGTKGEVLRTRPYRGKRAIDLGLLALAAVPAAIVGCLCAVAVRLTSPGPVLFRQERVGMAGRRFEVIKFRTMIDAPDNPIIPAPDRITPVGRWLRRLSLDELPQLVNVARGEMSIVGPRPTLEYQVERYTDHQRRRLAVKPGLSGLAQISGRNSLPWNERIELDIRYVERQSPGLDLRILIGTVGVVLHGSGVSGHAADDEISSMGPGE